VCHPIKRYIGKSSGESPFDESSSSVVFLLLSSFPQYFASCPTTQESIPVNGDPWTRQLIRHQWIPPHTALELWEVWEVWEAWRMAWRSCLRVIPSRSDPVITHPNTINLDASLPLPPALFNDYRSPSKQCTTASLPYRNGIHLLSANPHHQRHLEHQSRISSVTETWKRLTLRNRTWLLSYTMVTTYGLNNHLPLNPCENQQHRGDSSAVPSGMVMIEFQETMKVCLSVRRRQREEFTRCSRRVL
jgi:hypothetical protein